MKTIEKVCDFEGNIRLDVFVAEIGEITRSRAAKLIEDGCVLVNSKVAAKNLKLKTGDNNLEVPKKILDYIKENQLYKG